MLATISDHALCRYVWTRHQAALELIQDDPMTYVGALMPRIVVSNDNGCWTTNDARYFLLSDHRDRVTHPHHVTPKCLYQIVAWTKAHNLASGGVKHATAGFPMPPGFVTVTLGLPGLALANGTRPLVDYVIFAKDKEDAENARNSSDPAQPECCHHPTLCAPFHIKQQNLCCRPSHLLLCTKKVNTYHTAVTRNARARFVALQRHEFLQVRFTDLFKNSVYRSYLIAFCLRWRTKKLRSSNKPLSEL